MDENQHAASELSEPMFPYQRNARELHETGRVISPDEVCGLIRIRTGALSAFAEETVEVALGIAAQYRQLINEPRGARGISRNSE